MPLACRYVFCFYCALLDAAASGGYLDGAGGVRRIRGGDKGDLEGRGGEGFLQGHVCILLGVQRGVPLLCTVREDQEVRAGIRFCLPRFFFLCNSGILLVVCGVVGCSSTGSQH